MQAKRGRPEQTWRILVLIRSSDARMAFTSLKLRSSPGCGILIGSAAEGRAESSNSGEDTGE